jgi:hypothetical protein
MAAAYGTQRERRKMRTGFWWVNWRKRLKLGIPRRRWEDNPKMSVHEVG